MREARQSTLYNETGNENLYRVSEETRRKGKLVLKHSLQLSKFLKFIPVAADSKKIADDMVQFNLASRKRFKKEEVERCRVNCFFVCLSCQL